MQKVIPPRLVEPYLTGRRAVIAGFVYRAEDSTFASPGEFYHAMDLAYEGSDFSPETTEVYLLRWQAVGPDAYLVPYSAERGGDWTAKPPFTGTGFTASATHSIPEYFIDPVPVPVGAEIYRVVADGSEFIARFDGQVWLRPGGAV